ncbi:MAG: NADH-quinone oxidoreductase subunit M [Chloroflexota bacterium]|nr:NADH-quinone oxidoreductase subunit M [Chloroflexota bacterium]
MSFPFLSIIVFSPVVGALIIAALPKEKHLAIKLVAVVSAFISMVLSIYVFFDYDQAAGGMQFEEQIRWIPSLGISYHLGTDGISLPLLLLTGIIIFCGVLISWEKDVRPKEFFAFLLILVAGVFGVFVSLDLFLLFVFYELAVLPMYLLIGGWGWPVTREYAAMKLTLYLLVGSSIALIGILAIYFEAGLGTFDIMTLSQVGFTPLFQYLFFLPIFVGFGVLAGLWPLHTWSPDGHVAAPTAVSMLHAGVLMKMGAYSALRVGIFILPIGAQKWLPWIVVLTVVNVVYGSMVAFAQKDFKYVIGYSSVSHMGYVAMGLASMTVIGISGASLQMFSHGIMTGLFFAVVGLIYRRTHTRQIPELGGLARKMPFVAITFIIGGMASMGMPGLSGFVAEFQVLAGTWQAYPAIAAISLIGIVITAAYIIKVSYKVFFGSLKSEYEGISAVSTIEKVALFIMAALLIIVGLYPSILLDVINTGVVPIMMRLR